MTLIYKIIARETWQQAEQQGVFHGATIDLADGYIHLSTAQQAEETARKHFAGQAGLLLVAFEAADFASNLKWEASRGGDLFPHVYGTITPARAKWVKDLPLENGQHIFPSGWTQ
jgi:uncharacterized protein (DUF952 family)